VATMPLRTGEPLSRLVPDGSGTDGPPPPWESRQTAYCPYCKRTVSRSSSISWRGPSGPPTECLTRVSGVQLALLPAESPEN